MLHLSQQVEVNTVQIFDEDAATYDGWYDTKLGRFVDVVETRLAFDLLKPENEQRILDAGCGTGNFTLKLAHIGCVVTGIDVSAEMLNVARNKARSLALEPTQDLGTASKALRQDCRIQPTMAGNSAITPEGKVFLDPRLGGGLAKGPTHMYDCEPRVDFREMDMHRLDFPDDHFDGILSMAALEFLRCPRKALDELFRVTKSGGNIVVGTINRDSKWGALYLSKEVQETSIYKHANFRTPEYMESLKTENLVSVRECLFVPPDTPKEHLSWELENRLSSTERGGFICAQWKK